LRFAQSEKAKIAHENARSTEEQKKDEAEEQSTDFVTTTWYCDSNRRH